MVYKENCDPIKGILFPCRSRNENFYQYNEPTFWSLTVKGRWVWKDVGKHFSSPLLVHQIGQSVHNSIPLGIFLLYYGKLSFLAAGEGTSTASQVSLIHLVGIWCFGLKILMALWPLPFPPEEVLKFLFIRTGLTRESHEGIRREKINPTWNVGTWISFQNVS